MDLSFSVIGNATGAITFALLMIYAVRSYQRRATDKAILFATSTTLCWLLILTIQALGFELPFTLRYSLELLRTAAWFTVLYAILGVTVFPSKFKIGPQFFFTTGVITLISGLIAVLIIQELFTISLVSGKTLLVLNVLVSLVGILLLEQIWRNSSLFTRAGIKYLSIAVATILAYDFVMYSDALLFNRLSGALWDSRGAVNALAAPLIAATLVNRKGKALGIHISRQMVFHTTTLVIAGIYLLFVSAGGYYINVFGGSWGAALRVLFLFSAGIFLILVISSPNLRARTMVFISKNFFDYKYDYRDEWIKSTSSLQTPASESSKKESLYRRSTNTLAELVQAQAGVIWSQDEDGNLTFKDQFGFDQHNFGLINNDSDLIQYFNDNDWIINLNEYLTDPDKYGLIELPEFVLTCENPWLLVPLKVNDKLSAIVLLGKPYVPMDLNWENYDLLKIVAQQACSYIDQHSSEEQLAQSQQFEAVNQTSAFLIHDIKTIIAQLSMMVKNAPKHKSNPAFVDDMIETTRHSVEKMEHLLGQIRNPNQHEKLSDINLCDILSKVCYEKRNALPVPTLKLHCENIPIQADAQQLASVIEHITQNAIEACSKDGHVDISTKASPDYAFIFIQDNGSGMEEEFITNELFKPFSSTKGLTGMGIGAYQSREYLRKIGGSISVTSEPDIGTCFTLSIPLLEEPQPEQELQPEHKPQAIQKPQQDKEA